MASLANVSLSRQWLQLRLEADANSANTEDGQTAKVVGQALSSFVAVFCCLLLLLSVVAGAL